MLYLAKYIRNISPGTELQIICCKRPMMLKCNHGYSYPHSRNVVWSPLIVIIIHSFYIKENIKICIVICLSFYKWHVRSMVYFHDISVLKVITNENRCWMNGCKSCHLPILIWSIFLISGMNLKESIDRMIKHKVIIFKAWSITYAQTSTRYIPWSLLRLQPSTKSYKHKNDQPLRIATKV